MAKSFVIRWPDLDQQVRCRGIEHNEHIFDWFAGQLPIRAMQGHLLAAGWAISCVSTPLNKAVDWEPRTEVMEIIGEQAEGRLTLFMANGSSASVIVKYGEMTEPMSYPTFADVIPEDMDRLREVGGKVWHNLLTDKKIIIAEFLPEADRE